MRRLVTALAFSTSSRSPGNAGRATVVARAVGSITSVREMLAAAATGALVAIGSGAVVGAPAFADAPRTARVVESVSMAGVALDSVARLAPTGDRVRTGELARWGRVRHGSCFEGSNCSWRVAGGGTVDVIRRVRSARVQTIATTARGWRTARGIGRGSTRRSLRRAYGRRLVRRTTCGLNGFGGISTGYVLNSRRHGERRFTFLELAPSGERVRRVWIGRGRAAPGTRC